MAFNVVCSLWCVLILRDLYIGFRLRLRSAAHDIEVIAVPHVTPDFVVFDAFLVFHSFQFMDFRVLWLTWIWKCFTTYVLFGRPCIPTFVISAEAAYVTSCQGHEMVFYLLFWMFLC